MATVTPQTPDVAPTIPVDGDSLYEVVDGQVVEKATIGAYPTWLASLLAQAMGGFTTEHKRGRVVVEMLFRLGKDLQRRPDVAFVSHDRWPHGRQVPHEAAWDVVPDLAIEIVSPTNTADEIMTKVDGYFLAGVQRVWVVYPKARAVYLYESPNQVEILRVGDTLDGAPLLPGFHMPLAALFEEQAE
ncbi:Uma2 family endonuclease [Singulisphaera sp. Ch08]|uniref:Uma2 family endonuclease n=1 Tax=Singulisphaera sp. Ch08 TaxID=3120278 RepID=A0AAU7CL70_9BACT